MQSFHAYCKILHYKNAWCQYISVVLHWSTNVTYSTDLHCGGHFNSSILVLKDIKRREKKFKSRWDKLIKYLYLTFLCLSSLHWGVQLMKADTHLEVNNDNVSHCISVLWVQVPSAVELSWWEPVHISKSKMSYPFVLASTSIVLLGHSNFITWSTESPYPQNSIYKNVDFLFCF